VLTHAIVKVASGHIYGDSHILPHGKKSQSPYIWRLATFTMASVITDCHQISLPTVTQCQSCFAATMQCNRAAKCASGHIYGHCVILPHGKKS
jgi:hypothetical protein